MALWLDPIDDGGGLILSYIINFSVINHHASIINMNATTNMQPTNAVTKHQAFQVTVISYETLQYQVLAILSVQHNNDTTNMKLNRGNNIKLACQLFHENSSMQGR